MGALKAAVAAGANGSEAIAREALDLSRIIETFRKNPKGVSDISNYFPGNFEHVASLGLALMDRDLVANRNLSDAERVYFISDALPASATAADRAALTAALNAAGYPRMDAVAAALLISSTSASATIFNREYLDGVSAQAPYFMEQTIRSYPKQLPKVLDRYQEMRSNSNFEQYRASADAVQAIFQNSNQTAIAADKARTLLTRPEINRHLSPEAKQALRDELDRLELIARETLLQAQGHQSTLQELEKVSERATAAAKSIQQFSLGLKDAAGDQVYQVADLAKAVWKDPGAVERGILDAVSNPPEVAERIYRSYVTLMNDLETGDARTRGRAFGNLAVNTFFLGDGALAMSAAAIEAAKSSLAFQVLGATIKERLEKNPRFMDVVRDEAGELPVDLKRKLPLKPSDIASSLERWNNGLAGTVIDRNSALSAINGN